jgi:hypothetical protein
VSVQRRVDIAYVVGSEPPCLAKITARLAEGIERQKDVRLTAQDAESRLRDPVRTKIPAGHDVCGQLIAFLPDAIEVVPRQCDKEGTLL